MTVSINSSNSNYFDVNKTKVANNEDSLQFIHV